MSNPKFLLKTELLLEFDDESISDTQAIGGHSGKKRVTIYSTETRPGYIDIPRILRDLIK